MASDDVARDGSTNGPPWGSSTDEETHSGRSPVEIRAYEPADREGVRDLYDAVWTHPASDQWFDWLYVENPFVPDPPMLVADRDGWIVGIRPALDVPMRSDGRAVAGTLFTNAMVHPDLQGDGVYSALADAGLSQARERDREFVFGLANENSAPVLDHWGWTAVGTVPKRYRIQRPTSLLTDVRVPRVVSTVAQALWRPSVRATSPSVRSDVSVRRVADPPPSTLASLAREQPPRPLHAERSEQFYRWRLASPRFDTTTFVASTGGRDRAAIVTREREIAGAEAVQLFELVAPPSEEGVVSALVEAVLDASAETAVVTAPGTVWDAVPLGNWGFVSNESRLAALARVGGLTLFVTSLSGDVDAMADLSSWSIGGPLLEIL